MVQLISALCLGCITQEYIILYMGDTVIYIGSEHFIIGLVNIGQAVDSDWVEVLKKNVQ